MNMVWMKSSLIGHQLQTQVKQAIETYNSQVGLIKAIIILTPNEMHKQDKLKPKAWHKKSTTTLERSCGFLPLLQY